MRTGRGGRASLLVVGALVTGALAGCAAPDVTAPGAPPPDATSSGASGCELDAVAPFAQVPAPGHPFGLAVHEGFTYVSTSAAMITRPSSGPEHVFAFSPNGTLASDLVVETIPGATMGLLDVALDSHDEGHRLYVVDMNGRVLRAQLGPTPGDLGEIETYATIPAPDGALQWLGSMPMGMAFDPAGVLYLTDDRGRVWTIPPGESPTLWFESPTITGAAGARFGPDGKLYLSVAASGHPDSLAAGMVYRVPTGAAPQEADLEAFARLDPTPQSGEDQASAPDFTLLAFGASGRLYVASVGWQAIAVFDPDGTFNRVIKSPLFERPVGLAFLGSDLLVANSGDPVPAGEDPGKWQVLRVCVQDGGLPLSAPTGIP